MIKKFIFSALAVSLLSVNFFGQTTRKEPMPKPLVILKSLPTATPTPAPTLETILSEAEKQVGHYEQAFKDLLATETKTFQRYDKNGEAKDSTVIESDFLVYQSPKDQNVTRELRNVVKVDGKLVPDSQSRSQKFLADLQKTSTNQDELEKIRKEGARYDKTIEVYGYTLFEGRILDSRLRPVFNFQLLGSENYQGSDVYVISYQQTEKNPYITLNEGGNEYKDFGLDYRLDVPKELKSAEARVSGKLWIDKQTYRIWRQEENLTMQTDSPLTLLSTIYAYQTSDYDLLVPKQISLQTNSLKKDKETGQFQAAKDTSVTFDYSKFRKTDTDVKVLDDTN